MEQVFSEDEVASLNAFQASGKYHPYTCGNPDHEEHVNLVAGPEGWYCPALADKDYEEHCDYTQTFAHEFTKNWQWKAPEEKT